MLILMYVVLVLFLTFANYHSISSIIWAMCPEVDKGLNMCNAVYGVSLIISIGTVWTWNIWVDVAIVGLGLIVYLIKGE